MAATTGISWTDRTANPWEGCQKVSPACDNCYAEARNARFGPKGSNVPPNWGPGAPRRRISDATRRQWIRWNEEALRAGTRPFVFPSLCDPFDNAVDRGWRREWFGEMRDTPALLWLLLTKRPQNVEKMVDEVGFFPSNIALGTTVEDRLRLKNLDHLGRAASVLRPVFTFGSFEPLLEDLGDLSRWLEWLDMAIVGGESGPRARPIAAEWVRSIHRQTEAAGKIFHFKQWGTWRPLGQGWVGEEGVPDRFTRFENGISADRWRGDKAGRLLDGVLYDGRPTVPPL